MTTSEKGLALIKHFEGLRLTAYQCAAGVWTIGYGHTSGVKKGQTITKAKAESYLKTDVARFEKAVNALKRDFTQNQFDALVSFAFNCGESNLKTLCKGRTVAVIADKLLLYNKAGGKVNAGLVERRKAERELFVTGMVGAQKCPYTEPTKTVTSIKQAKAKGCKSYLCKGEGVKWVQWMLNSTGKFRLEVDGQCGDLTVGAITEFQKFCGLMQDGLCGEKTRKKLLAA